MQTNNQQQYRVRINNYIRVPQVKVIDAEGNFLGIMATYEALKIAQEQGLDLVEVNARATPPLVKIIDYGKFKYEEKKKLSEQKKNQKVQELKEISFRPNTDENDLNHKLQQAKEFLADGNKIKFTVKFRGREITHPELGRAKLEWIIQQLSSLIAPSPSISLEGKFMSMLVTPSKQK